jgi:hypothetical protein
MADMNGRYDIMTMIRSIHLLVRIELVMSIVICFTTLIAVWPTAATDVDPPLGTAWYTDLGETLVILPSPSSLRFVSGSPSHVGRL